MTRPAIGGHMDKIRPISHAPSLTLKRGCHLTLPSHTFSPLTWLWSCKSKSVYLYTALSNAWGPTPSTGRSFFTTLRLGVGHRNSCLLSSDIETDYFLPWSQRLLRSTDAIATVLLPDVACCDEAALGPCQQGGRHADATCCLFPCLLKGLERITQYR